MKNRISFFSLMLSLIVIIVVPLRAAKAVSEQTPIFGELIGYSDETGQVSFIGSLSKAGISVPGAGAPAMSVQECAAAVLDLYAPLFGEAEPGRNLLLISTSTRGGNQKSYRYQQTYQGIPIIGAEIFLNLTAQGTVSSISGELSPGIDLSTDAVISPEEALRKAGHLIALSYQVDPEQIEFSAPELWIFDERLLLPSSRPAELVWRIEARSFTRPVNELVLVNAHSGRISLHFNQVDAVLKARQSQGYAIALDPDLLIPDSLSLLAVFQLPTNQNQYEAADQEAVDVESLEVVRLEVIQGSGQTADLKTPFAQALAVAAFDQYDDPLPGVQITFSAPADPSASVSFGFLGPNQITITTDADGIGETPQVFANQAVGTFSVTATEPNSGASVSFELENTDGPYWYVSTTGSDSTNDCRTPEAPCGSINGAMNKTEFQEGDTVLVRGGVYTGLDDYVVLIEKDVNIRGGWNADFTKQSGETIIDGESERGGLASDFLLEREFNLYLEDLTIINGGPEALQDANMVLYFTTGAIENCTFAQGLNHGVMIQGSNISLNKVNAFDNQKSGIWISNRVDISEVEIRASSITGNQQTGIYVHDSDLSVENSTISQNNLSSTYGGGINFDDTNKLRTLSLKSVTIANNRASYGAGIFSRGTTQIQNSILANNVNFNGYPSNCWGTILSDGYNLVGSTNGCNFSPLANDHTEMAVHLLPLGNYGGETLTHAILTGSPASDAANPLAPGTNEFSCSSSDQRGEARPFDGDGDGIARCDIGAYEYSGVDSTPVFQFPLTDSPVVIRTDETIYEAFEIVVLGPTGGAVGEVPVTFSAPETGPGGLFDGSTTITTQTDSRGIASSGVYTTNGLYGSYTVVVQVAGFEEGIEFAVRNVSAHLNTYEMRYQGEESLPGDFLCDELMLPCTNGANLDADSAHQTALAVYEFFHEQHGRDSFDGAGGTIISSVNYSFYYFDSFWNGSQVVYGSGDDYPQADDIVAHEITHGMTEHTSGLFYYYQSGAINESFSDLWGEGFDQLNDLGLDDANYRWEIGENLSTGPLRSMSDPTSYGQPDKMTSPYYHLGDLEDLNEVPFDNGGIHTNSGINNKAVYLMVDGDTFNGVTVHGIGWQKVLAIYYEAQTSLLTSGSDYGDLYLAVQQACYSLIGEEEGITEDDCIQVVHALDAVEMEQQPVPDFNPDAPLCPENFTPAYLFDDSFETGADAWAFTSEGSTEDTWRWTDGYAADGTYAIQFSEFEGTTAAQAEMLNPVELPLSGEIFLNFSHSFAFDYLYDQENNRTYLDGGVLQAQIDDGAWIDLGNLSDSGVGYNGTVSPDSNSTLAGLQAFVADSHGYVGSRYDLSGLAGQSVRFRWVAAMDRSTANSSWQIDQVRIYTCNPGVPAIGPDNIDASDGLFNNHISISWDVVESAEEYHILRDTDPNGTAMVQIGTVVLPPFDDYEISDLQIYYYWIRACNLSGCSPPSGPESGYADWKVPGVLFEDGFESGDFSQWSRVNLGGGFLTVCSEGALNGSWGTCVDRGTNDKRKVLIDDTPVDQKNLSVRFSFDINDLSMPEGTRFRFLEAKQGLPRTFFLVLRRLNGQYQIQFNILVDGQLKFKSSWYTLSDTPHTIEIDWHASNEPGLNEGHIQLYMDDALLEEMTGLDNDTHFVSSLRIGFIGRLDGSPISGIWYVDDVATSSMGYIGLP